MARQRKGHERKPVGGECRQSPFLPLFRHGFNGRGGAGKGCNPQKRTKDRVKNPAKNPDRVVPSKGGAGVVPGNPGNSGGKKGRSGRPPDEFRDRMQAAASEDAAADYLDRCLAGEFGPKVFLQALAYATDRGYGRPTQPVEHAGKDGAPIDVRVTRIIVRPGDPYPVETGRRVTTTTTHLDTTTDD